MWLRLGPVLILPVYDLAYSTIYIQKHSCSMLSLCVTTLCSALARGRRAEGELNYVILIRSRFWVSCPRSAFFCFLLKNPFACQERQNQVALLDLSSFFSTTTWQVHVLLMQVLRHHRLSHTHFVVRVSRAFDCAFQLRLNDSTPTIACLS